MDDLRYKKAWLWILAKDIARDAIVARGNTSEYKVHPFLPERTKKAGKGGGSKKETTEQVGHEWSRTRHACRVVENRRNQLRIGHRPVHDRLPTASIDDYVVSRDCRGENNHNRHVSFFCSRRSQSVEQGTVSNLHTLRWRKLVSPQLVYAQTFTRGDLSSTWKPTGLYAQFNDDTRDTLHSFISIALRLTLQCLLSVLCTTEFAPSSPLTPQVGNGKRVTWLYRIRRLDWNRKRGRERCRETERKKETQMTTRHFKIISRKFQPQIASVAFPRSLRVSRANFLHLYNNVSAFRILARTFTYSVHKSYAAKSCGIARYTKDELEPTIIG